MKHILMQKSVVYRLFFTYALLTLVVALLIGSLSTIMFTAIFNNEVENMNEHFWKYERDTISYSVFNKVKEFSLNMVLSQKNNKDIHSFFTSAIKNDHTVIMRAKNRLSEYLINNEIINSIVLYNTDQNVLLSSKYGVRFLDLPSNQHYENLKWLQYKAGTKSGSWMAVPDEFGNTEIIYICVPQSYIDNSEECGIIAIYLNPKILANLFKKLKISGFESFLVDDKGTLVMSTNPLMFDDMMSNKANLLTLTQFSTTETINKKKYMTYCLEFAENGWGLIFLTSTERFYSLSKETNKKLILITFVTILIGFILTNIFSKKMYKPLKQLALKIRQKQDNENVILGTNEYTLINQAFDDLNNKLSTMEVTLQQNLPTIRNSFILGIAKGDLESQKRYKEYLKLLNIDFNRPYFCCMIFNIDLNSKRSIPLQDQQYIKFNTCNEIEKQSCFGCDIFCTVTGNEQIVAIVNSNTHDYKLEKSKIEKISSYLMEKFQIRIAAACGEWNTSLLELASSYNTAKKIIKYRFVLPTDNVFISPVYLQQEQNIEALPESFWKNLDKALLGRQIKEVESCMELFVANASHSSSKILETQATRLGIAVIDYCKSMGYGLDAELKDSFSAPVNWFWTIKEFKSKIIKQIAEAFSFIDEMRKLQNVNLIEKVKLYISENLRKELSLETLSEIVYLSPKYLSRLFKSITGENLVEYISIMRMKSACTLLETTNMSVNEISSAVGYSNCTYFIKRFKEYSGYTPRSYKLNKRVVQC